MTFLREPNAEPLPGYRLIKPLGTGGFGEVWKCEAPGGLYKAIKFVYGSLNSLDMEGARAEQEWKAISRIKEVRHAFVLSTEQIIRSPEGELIIVMELADKSLQDAFVEAQAAGMIGLPRNQLLGYIRDAAEALDYMHEKFNLQHLDIKPHNLFLVSERVKVGDFGLVKHLERASGILGGVTPLYAAPETFLNKLSNHSDQYSLAIVYQELATGHRPFNGKNVRMLAQQHMQEAPELRSLNEAERPVIARALEKEPGKRYPSCLAFVRELMLAGRARSRAGTAGGSRPEIDMGPGQKPMTISDTLEDMQLDMLEEGDLLPPLPRPAPKQPTDGELVEISDLGLTRVQPEHGVLRPTLVIGLGSFGRRAIQELRCRFLDHYGDLGKIPLLQFLYIDVDIDGVNAALAGTPEVALNRNETYHLSLQPFDRYRARQLDQLGEWLPREKLFAMPRSLKTQGSRALGRLAFSDHHKRLMSRVSKLVQLATHPDAMFHTVSQTNLAVRDNVPRILVLAAAGGGSSGMLVDLGYSIRRLMAQLRHAETTLTTMLLCGAPQDPATPAPEQANVYATLTELNHFNDTSVTFTAQYAIDGGRLRETSSPFDTTYLLPLPYRTPEALRDVTAHLGNYLFHEITTPLGARLDRERQVPAPPGATPFRSFGTYSVWFPRGLLLRVAARRALRQMLVEWQDSHGLGRLPEVEAACQEAVDSPDLHPETLTARVEAAASDQLDGTPAQALTMLLATMEEQSQQAVAQDDPASWARQALTRVREWLGTGSGSGHDNGDWRKSRLHRALTIAAQKVAETEDKRLTEVAARLMEAPGKRVATAEAALEWFRTYCDQAIASWDVQFQQQGSQAERAWEALQASLAACNAGMGGFSLFGGGRSRRGLRSFMDSLAVFARHCLAEELINASRQCFAHLRSRLGERLQDLGFCRQRLRHLEEMLDAPPADTDDTAYGAERTPTSAALTSADSYWEEIRESPTARVVLPEGQNDLEGAANAFLAGLSTQDWDDLDRSLQECVLSERGGLHGICMSSADLVKHLAVPLLDQMVQALGESLEATDVAQAEFSSGFAGAGSLAAQVRQYQKRATPMLKGARSDSQRDFLLAPNSAAGKEYAAEASKAIEGLQIVPVPSQADLMFCCEQGYLSLHELQPMLKPLHVTYSRQAMAPQSSPHARCDIADWIPLDP